MPERFTAKERDLIRMEFMVRQGWSRQLSEGIFLYRWGSGPHKGKPKVKKAVQSMLDRGLVKIVDPAKASAYARFTAAGFAALRDMARDRRLLPPDQYGHLIEELQGTTPANENSRKRR